MGAFPGDFNLPLAHPSFGNTLAELRRDRERFRFVKQQICGKPVPAAHAPAAATCMCLHKFPSTCSSGRRRPPRYFIAGAVAVASSPARSALAAVSRTPAGLVDVDKSTPSTGSATQIMKFASSDARKSAALATSQGAQITTQRYARIAGSRDLDPVFAADTGAPINRHWRPETSLAYFCRSL
jgi:hypothetical protein